VLNAPTVKESSRSVRSLLNEIFLTLMKMNKVVAPSKQRQKATPIGENDELAKVMKKNEEPQIRPEPK